MMAVGYLAIQLNREPINEVNSNRPNRIGKIMRVLVPVINGVTAMIFNESKEIDRN
jgi:hypothetical protein